MKLKLIAVAVGMAASASVVAEEMMPVMVQSNEQLEARVAELEARVAYNEQTGPADNAVLTTVPGINTTLGGDVEFNLDGVSKVNNFTGQKEDNANWNMNGRILLDIDANKTNANGVTAGAHIQPLMDIHGSVNLDDAEFYIGQENDWKLKVGRFKAYDMFSLNEDTFVEYSGNTSNDLYNDKASYSYQMREGRGRSGSGGSILMSKQIDNWYFELNTLAEKGSDLFVKGTYHGNKVEDKKNAVYLRPVIAYTDGNWTTAVGLESNVIRNSYGYTDKSGKFIDQSKRNGAGATFKYDNGNIAWNLNFAAMDAAQERNGSVGTNIWFKNTELGYIYSHNSNSSAFNPGKVDVHTIHATHKFSNVMDLENLNVYVGAFSSFANAKTLKDGEDADRYGVRARIKYFF